LSVALNKRYLKRSAIIAGILEGVLLFLGIREMYLGGMEEFGGYIFSFLHLPSSLVLAYISQFLQVNGFFADIVFVGFSAISQFILFVAIAYWLHAVLRSNRAR
jgi:hypothetical protein